MRRSSPKLLSKMSYPLAASPVPSSKSSSSPQYATASDRAVAAAATLQSPPLGRRRRRRPRRWAWAQSPTWSTGFAPRPEIPNKARWKSINLRKQQKSGQGWLFWICVLAGDRFFRSAPERLKKISWWDFSTRISMLNKPSSAVISVVSPIIATQSPPYVAYKNDSKCRKTKWNTNQLWNRLWASSMLLANLFSMYICSSHQNFYISRSPYFTCHCHPPGLISTPPPRISTSIQRGSNRFCSFWRACYQ